MDALPLEKTAGIESGVIILIEDALKEFQSSAPVACHTSQNIDFKLIKDQTTGAALDGIEG